MQKPVRTAYVAFESLAQPPLTVAGVLSIPESEAACGAVLLCHGSDGVDGRGAFHARALNAAGFATLEIDMWAARGTARGAGARPRTVPETLPDAFGALAFLRRQPEIDPARIAIMGFSWGGVVTMLSATRAKAEPLLAGAAPFAAHVALYPVLWSYNRAPGHEFSGLTGAPVLIEAGEADAYDTPAAIAAFEASLDAETRARLRLTIQPNATHAFDRDLPDKVVVDPFAHDGKGGEVAFRFNRPAAERARAEAVAFIAEAFARV
jgi:dienelactone hydrolase